MLACLAAMLVSHAMLVPLPESERPKGFLGITVSPAPGNQGLLITLVTPASPAEHAGLQFHDRITFLNGARVENLESFVKAIGELHAGKRIKLTIIRDGKEQDVRATLGRKRETR